jgi:hypothetical protein
MAATIKISDESIIQDVRKESQLMSRSLGEQATHWMKIGKFIERSNLFDLQKIKKILMGQLSPDLLSSDEEQAIYLGLFENAMVDENKASTAEQEAYYQNRVNRGLGVGLDTSGHMVEQLEVEGKVSGE